MKHVPEHNEELPSQLALNKLRTESVQNFLTEREALVKSLSPVLNEENMHFESPLTAEKKQSELLDAKNEEFGPITNEDVLSFNSLDEHKLDFHSTPMSLREDTGLKGFDFPEAKLLKDRKDVVLK